MNASLSHSQHASLQTRIRAMVEKIEKFNTTGLMEGAPSSKNGAKLYSSMKQEVMDMCESKYDAEILKYCIDQPDEALDELQIRMRAFIAKVKCYNQFVDEANTATAVSPHKKPTRKSPRKIKLPKLSAQMTAVNKDAHTMKNSAASFSLALVERKRREHDEHKHKRQFRSTPSSRYVSEESSTSSESYSNFNKRSPRYCSKGRDSLPPSVRRKNKKQLPLPGSLPKERQMGQSNLQANCVYEDKSHNIGDFYEESPVPNSYTLAARYECFDQFDDSSTLFQHQGRHHGGSHQHKATLQTERVSLPSIKSSRTDHYGFSPNYKLDQSPELFSTQLSGMFPVTESTPISAVNRHHRKSEQVRSRPVSPIHPNRERAKFRTRKDQLQSMPTSPSEEYKPDRSHAISQPSQQASRRAKSRPSSPKKKSQFVKGRAKSRLASSPGSLTESLVHTDCACSSFNWKIDCVYVRGRGKKVGNN